MLKQQQKKDSQLGPILEGKCSLPELYQIRFAKKRDKKEADYSLLVVPEILKEPVMYAGHEAAGHFGSHKTKTLVSKHFYWPKMGKEIIQYCKTCPVCLQWNHHKEAKPLLQPLPVVLTPWSKVAPAHQGYLLTVIDFGTRFVEAIPPKKVDAKSTCQALLHVFACFGVPDTILTDNGSNFVALVT